MNLRQALPYVLGTAIGGLVVMNSITETPTYLSNPKNVSAQEAAPIDALNALRIGNCPTNQNYEPLNSYIHIGGNHIVYKTNCYQNGKTQLIAYNIETGASQVVYNDSSFSRHYVNGDEVAYRGSTGGIYVYNFVTSQTVQLDLYSPEIIEASGLPAAIDSGTETIGSISPDGTKLIFNARYVGSNIIHTFIFNKLTGLITPLVENENTASSTGGKDLAGIQVMNNTDAIFMNGSKLSLYNIESKVITPLKLPNRYVNPIIYSYTINDEGDIVVTLKSNQPGAQIEMLHLKKGAPLNQSTVIKSGTSPIYNISFAGEYVFYDSPTNTIDEIHYGHLSYAYNLTTGQEFLVGHLPFNNSYEAKGITASLFSYINNQGQLAYAYIIADIAGYDQNGGEPYQTFQIVFLSDILDLVPAPTATSTATGTPTITPTYGPIPVEWEFFLPLIISSH